VGGVILSAAKDLSSGRAQILRCAQDDNLWQPARFKKTYPCKDHEGRPYNTRASLAASYIVGAGLAPNPFQIREEWEKT